MEAMKNEQSLLRKRMATICLMFGTFVNPFGFDAFQMMLVQLTGSLLRANGVLYCLAALFFGLYFLLSNINPFKTMMDIFLSIYRNRIHHFKISRNKIVETDEDNHLFI